MKGSPSESSRSYKRRRNNEGDDLTDYSGTCDSGEDFPRCRVAARGSNPEAHLVEKAKQQALEGVSSMEQNVEALKIGLEETKVLLNFIFASHIV